MSLQRVARAATMAAVLVPLLAVLPGCGRLVRAAARPYAVTPTGLELPEHALRTYLAHGRWDAARAHLARPEEGGPSDALLRALYEGTTAYYAGRWRESAAALDRAAALADDRYTKSVSRGVLAIAANDRALPYLPGHGERLMVHYYAMLAFLQADDLPAATVEARRLALLLQRYDDARDDTYDRSTRAVLRYLTGAVFEAAGEGEDAGVAYRNARALLEGGTAGAPAGGARPGATALPAALSAALPSALAPTSGRPVRDRPRPGGPHRVATADTTGEVVVVVERGFVAHRVDERLTVRLGAAGDPAGGWEGGRAPSTGPAGGDGDALGALASRVARLLGDDDALWADALPRQPLLLADQAPPVERPVGSASDSATAAAAPPLVPSLPNDPIRVPEVDGVRRPGRGAASRGPGRGPDERPELRPGRGPGARGRVRGGEGRTGQRDTADTTDGADAVRDAVLAGRVRGEDGTWADRASRLVTLAWPAYRRPAALAPVLGVVAGGGPAGRPSAHGALTGARAAADEPPAPPSVPGVSAGVLRGDLSLAAAGDFKRDRARLLARLVARAAVRQTLVAQAGRKHRELGELAAALGSAVEHADTRSWHLLPGTIEIVRLRLPAGRHALHADVDGRLVPLGGVDVPRHGIAFLTARVWDGDGSALAPPPPTR